MDGHPVPKSKINCSFLRSVWMDVEIRKSPPQRRVNPALTHNAPCPMVSAMSPSTFGPWRRLTFSFSIAALLLARNLDSRAAVLFSDTFDSGASPLWQNESGSWAAASGVYAATVPNNFPNAHSSLPFNLTNFFIDVDINAVADGGIWLRSAPAPR
jgi:hypothetical protein